MPILVIKVTNRHRSNIVITGIRQSPDQHNLKNDSWAYYCASNFVLVLVTESRIPGQYWTILGIETIALLIGYVRKETRETTVNCYLGGRGA